MFYRLGLKIVARARVVLAMSVVALVISAALGVGAFARLLSGGFDDPASASSQAKVLLDQKFGGEPDLIFLVHARTGTVDGTAVTATGQALAHRLSADARLRGVTSYWTTQAPGLRSRDSTDALILAKVIGDEQTADTNAKALLADYAHLDSPDATVRIGGARGTDVAGQVGKDLAVAEAIAVPITVVLMIIVFGSLVASLLPLAIGVLAIFATFAELDLLTHVTSVSVFAINLATGLGLGLGMDYALLMVSRFREELAKGVDVGDAVARTMATAGRTIAFSALAVAAALSAMLVFPVYFLKSFAYAGVGVTIFSAASALLVLPALLAVLGRRVNSGRIRGIRAVRERRSAVLGATGWRRDAPANCGCAPGYRGAAVPGDTAAFGHFRDPGRAGPANECGESRGRRRSAQRLRDHARRHRRTDHPRAFAVRTAGLYPTAQSPERGATSRHHHRNCRGRSSQSRSA